MTPASQIAHYKIVSKLGEGGMGAVYRATDTKLNRDVAIKVLPDAFTQNTDRMARFEREAQVLASLNHPNIAAIYGVEERAIVMELVEGPTLSDRIAQGPVALDEALVIARQIADALEAAHEKGVVHRDLKPANIKVTLEGRVKILDFGLAKLMGDEPPAGDPASSPTLTMRATMAGVILGTAAYMSPEQAAGKPVDKRADIWSFGVVLHELLSGRRLFEGETIGHTLANVLTKELELNTVTPSIRPLLRRCLQRDVRHRLRDIGDARLMLDETVEAPVSDRRRWLPWVLACALGLAALAAAGLWLRTTPLEIRAVSFPLGLPGGTSLDPFSLARPQAVPSPDGRYIAFVVRDARTSRNNLWVRSLNLATAQRVDLTEGADTPFWSPDSRFIGFFSEQSLKKVAVSGGKPQTILQGAGGGNWGADWSNEGIIVFSSRGRLMRVPASGGEATAVTTLDASLGEDAHHWPQFLEDGRHILYFAGNSDSAKSGIFIYEIGSAKRTLVLKTRSRGVFAPPGYLLFVREGTLFAQRLNPKTFQPTGEPVSLVSKVIENPAGYNASFAVSRSGLLVYRSGASIDVRQLTWYDREGKRLDLAGSPGEYLNMSLSPDGKRAALVRAGPNGYDTWIMDLGSGLLTQLTFDLMKRSYTPVVWSPDSERLALSPPEGPTEIVVATGAATHLFSRPLGAPSDWSPDGRFVMFADFTTICVLPLVPEPEGGQRKPNVLHVSPFSISQPRYSPDGRWVAYSSEETGDPHVNVASLPSFADKRRISNGGGIHPVWRKDGKELFYLAPDGALMAAEIKPGLKLESGMPKSLFKVNLTFGLSFGSAGGQFGVSADGRRFLVAELVQKNQDIQDIVVLNWMAELKQ